jgi:DNA-directed RNA polymerase specialized sigma24 family protein
MDNPVGRNAVDARIAAMIASRDPRAGLELTRTYGPGVLAYLRSKGVQRQDALDILEVAAEQAILGYKEDKGSSVRTFLFNVAARRWVDYVRAAKRRVPRLVALANGAAATSGTYANVLDELVAREEHELRLAEVRRVIADLTDLQRSALLEGFGLRGRVDGSPRSHGARKTMSVALQRVREVVSRPAGNQSKGASRATAKNRA